MSFILLATAAMVAASAAGFLYARRGSSARLPEAAPPAGPAPPAGMDRFALTLGDVVSVEAGGSTREGRVAYVERWLTGVLVAREGAEVVGALFTAPEGAAEEAVAVFAPPRKDIAWLSRVPLEAAGASGADLPAALEIGSTTMRRRSRVPVQLERGGRGGPKVAGPGIWAEYEATGRAVAIVVQAEGSVFAWHGTRYESGEYDRMGSGGVS
jgi:hypothetical protein